MRFKTNRAMLVYQGAIANVFEVQQFGLTASARGETQRHRQGDFRACENFVLGFHAADGEVRFAACDQAGDIASSDWTTPLD